VASKKILVKYILFINLLVIVIFANLNAGCKKALAYSKGNLAFSKDTVVFDTVFTTIGSTTQQLKIYNKENRTVVIEEIQLMGGSSSPFRINFDGLMGTNFAGIELEGKDSLYTFIEVTLNPNGGNLPMVIEDSIRFRTNGKDQYVILAAWGQDMYYHFSDLDGPSIDWNYNSGTWPNDKPHLIYGGAFIAEGNTLTIPAGTDIYLHHKAYLFNFKGTLNILGTKEDPVTFQGDRLESLYDDVSGQYYGIYFKEAKPSSINYAIIKNGTTGIHIESEGANGGAPTVTVTNTKIYNCASYGILNFYGGRLKAENCIIAKNGYHAFINIGGSEFNFLNCHLLGYANGQQQLPAVGISDFYQSDAFNLTGTMRNCVLYGNQEVEIAFNLSGATTPVLNFDYNLIKSSPAQTGANFAVNNNFWSGDPAFKNVADYDFEYWSTSSLINAGSGPGTPHDIKGVNRDLSQPDIGAYEF